MHGSTVDELPTPPVVRLDNDALTLWDHRLGSILYKLGFFGKPLGLRKPKPGPLNRPLVLSLFDAFYLLKNKIIRVQLGEKSIDETEFLDYAKTKYDDFPRKFTVYEYLRKLGYIVRPGMKFGSDFAIYEKGPGFDHSKWVVHVEDNDKLLKAIEIVRAGRLAASVKKKYLIVTIFENKPVFFGFDRVKI